MHGVFGVVVVGFFFFRSCLILLVGWIVSVSFELCIWLILVDLKLRSIDKMEKRKKKKAKIKY